MTKGYQNIFAIFLLIIGVHSAQALDLILQPGEVLDLARSPNVDHNFLFDNVTLNDRSVILIPSSFKISKLTINDFQSMGTSYIVVYDDEIFPNRTVPTKLQQADKCTAGAPGQVGAAGGTRSKVQLHLTIGFLNVDRLVILAEGVQGLRGGKGGDGQDGGDSGGAERCVVNSCDGGNGGTNGLGGRGGPGGDGGDVVLNFSGLSRESIHLYSDENNYFPELFANLSIGPDIQEKIIGEHNIDAHGFNILVGAVGQERTLAMRGRLPPVNVEYESGVSVVVAGGNGGSSGANGDLTGSGGAGYRCSVGRHQKRGSPGLPHFMSNTNGSPGKPGQITLNKLD